MTCRSLLSSFHKLYRIYACQIKEQQVQLCNYSIEHSFAHVNMKCLLVHARKLVLTIDNIYITICFSAINSTSSSRYIQSLPASTGKERIGVVDGMRLICLPSSNVHQWAVKKLQQVRCYTVYLHRRLIMIDVIQRQSIMQNSKPSSSTVWGLSHMLTPPKKAMAACSQGV